MTGAHRLHPIETRCSVLSRCQFHMLSFWSWTSANWRQPKAVLPAGPRVFMPRCLLVSISSRSNRLKHLSSLSAPGHICFPLSLLKLRGELRFVLLSSHIFTWETKATEEMVNNPLLLPVWRFISSAVFVAVKHLSLTTWYLMMLNYFIFVA